MTSPAVDEYGEIVDSSSGIGEYGRFYFGNWSENGIFRIGVWASQILDEVVGLVDYRNSSIQRVVNESVGVIDEVVVTPLKIFAEALDIDDRVIEWVHGSTKLVIEYIGLVDNEIKRDVNRVTTEIFEIGKDLARISEWGHVMVDTYVSEYGRWWENELEEEGNVLNEGYKGEVLEKYVVKGLVESISHWHGWPLRSVSGRVLMDNVVLNDIELFEKIKILLETIGLDDVVGNVGVMKVVEDGVVVVDGVVKEVAKKVFEEVVELVDVFIRGKEKILEEIMSIADVGRLADIDRSWREDVNVSDWSIRNVVKDVLEEAVGLLDRIVFGGDYWKMVTEGIGLSDGIVKGVVSSKVEFIDVADVWNRYASGRILLESLGLDDFVEVITKNYKMLAEALGLTDHVSINPLWHVYEVVNLQDVLSKQPTLAAIVETIGALTDILGPRTPVLSRVESLQILDSALERTMGILVRELVTLVDTPYFAIEKELTDIVDLIDGVARRFKSKVRKMAGVISRTKMGAFVKRKVHNTFKKITMDSTFWSGDDEE